MPINPFPLLARALAFSLSSLNLPLLALPSNYTPQS